MFSLWRSIIYKCSAVKPDIQIDESTNDGVEFARNEIDMQTNQYASVDGGFVRQDCRKSYIKRGQVGGE